MKTFSSALIRMFLTHLSGKNATNWLMALATIFVIAGAPFLEEELNKCIEGFFRNALVKKLVLFSSIYLNTQDAYISGFCTIIYAIFAEIILAKPLNQQRQQQQKQRRGPRR